jgi:tetratricopeptide (TPR) repeat protein
MRWILLSLAWTLIAAPVWAQTDDEKNCLGSNPDIAIIGCTAAIASGRESKSYLAVSYYARGNAYFAEDFLDQAISDYTEVITLQPDNALAHLNRGNALAQRGFLTKPSPITTGPSQWSPA